LMSNTIKIINSSFETPKVLQNRSALIHGVFALSLFLLASLNASSQDIHFSQFHEIPLNISPSFAGNSESSSKRAGLIYRNQWNSVSTPFQSSGFYGDMKLSPKFLKGAGLGIGVLILNDRSGSGGLKQNHLNAMVNYQKFIDSKKTMLVVAGLQLGIFQKGYDPSKLNFESDYSYETATFVSNSSLQTLGKTSIISPELGVGASFTYFNKRGKSTSVGVAFAHLTTPEQSFLADTDPLKIKTSIHVKTVKRLKDNLHFYPMGIIMLQKEATSYIGGGQFIYSLGRALIEQTDLKAGVFYRHSDALFFTAGLNHDNWGLNFGYDYNISELGQAAKNVNAFEIAISIRNRLFKNQNKKFIIPGNRLL
ncbi:MAG: type IX secretion system PorP/SprF family membrane protein, partial [Glaciecola sp.]